jgi:hypothetical protein
LVEELVRMSSFSRWGRIAVAAGSVALLSFEAVHLESPKVASAVESAEEMKRSAEKTVEQRKQEEVKAAARRSKAPKMAPQFDGLNFYETFIGAAQR